MKRYLFFILLICSFSMQAQTKIGDYKYMIVPEKFNFLKQVNQYNLNALAKALFEDSGFIVYYDNSELPAEIADNKCNALMVDLEEKSSMFSTSIFIVIKDCKGTVLLKSKEGKSREKEYKPAYNEALRAAFATLNDFKDTPVQPAATQQTSQPNKTNVAVKTTATAPLKVDARQTTSLLYAQPIKSGYQLIDATPKIVMTLQKTTVENCFIANNGTNNGVIIKKDDNWFFEYYKDDILISEKLSIKF